MYPKVVTFGEVMMRLSPPGNGRILQADNLNVLYAGSEANVASSLALWGVPSAHVTTFPDHDLGKAAVSWLRKFGVDTSFVSYASGRLGMYLIEGGASLRSPKIIYDRFDSCFANAAPSTYNWDRILDGVKWFHWSGITPAISQHAATACLEAIETASAKGITVSGDINYRRNLWQYGKTARDIMPALIEKTSVVVAGITDFENCVGITGKTFEEACARVVEKYPSVTKVTTTTRETLSASHNRISAMLWNGKETFHTGTHDLAPIVDRVGSGDAYMAGVVYGFLAGMTDQETVDFATAACALKHTIEGDVNTASLEEVKTLLAGENIGKLLR